MDKLAEGLQKLGEDDLLQVVQMVHDNKSADSYTKNDVERMLLFPELSSFDEQRLIIPQRANSTLTCTPFPIR